MPYTVPYLFIQTLCAIFLPSASPPGAPRIIPLQKGAEGPNVEGPRCRLIPGSTPSSALHAPTPSRSAVILPPVSLQHRPLEDANIKSAPRDKELAGLPGADVPSTTTARIHSRIRIVPPSSQIHQECGVSHQMHPTDVTLPSSCTDP
ncbi:hypothetical protein B0H13DRAFT_2322093 [Mycena leptocephala]|nr:hypothetical protein B0H13DRAFT_2322093 [Mycena leptocephala]